jgi:hypothetical protein
MVVATLPREGLSTAAAMAAGVVELFRCPRTQQLASRLGAVPHSNADHAAAYAVHVVDDPLQRAAAASVESLLKKKASLRPSSLNALRGFSASPFGRAFHFATRIAY